MPSIKPTRWAARCWHWKSEEAKDDELGDLADQQVETLQEAPSKGRAHRVGRRLAAQSLATSPGDYDLMRGVPDQYEPDGVRWVVDEEVRP